MAPFYGWDSTASRLEPLRGGSLLFTTKFPEQIYKNQMFQALITCIPYNIFQCIVACCYFHGLRRLSFRELSKQILKLV